MTAKKLVWLVSVLALSVTTVARGQTLPIVTDVDPQPFIAQAMRLIEALEFLGNALPEADARRLEQLRDEAPIRASRRSAEWCRLAVDRCWLMKAPLIREEERVEAEAAYDHARRVYDEIIRTSSVP